MTRAEFRAILLPLTLAMRTEFDAPTWVAYYRALEDVPAALVSLAVDTLLRSPLEFFPKAGELRTMAERQRRVLLSAYPYDGCAECESSKGWRSVIADGVAGVERCPCLGRHRARLAQLGLVDSLTDLPTETGAGDERVYPTLDQLPAALQQRLREVASQKVLR